MDGRADKVNLTIERTRPAERIGLGAAATCARTAHTVMAGGTAIESVVHVTMPGNELMREIHNGGSNPYRMPAILHKEDHEAWLTGTIDEARAVLRPYPSGLMVEQLLEPAKAA